MSQNKHENKSSKSKLWIENFAKSNHTNHDLQESVEQQSEKHVNKVIPQRSIPSNITTQKLLKNFSNLSLQNNPTKQRPSYKTTHYIQTRPNTIDPSENIPWLHQMMNKTKHNQSRTKHSSQCQISSNKPTHQDFAKTNSLLPTLLSYSPSSSLPSSSSQTDEQTNKTHSSSRTYKQIYIHIYLSQTKKQRTRETLFHHHRMYPRYRLSQNLQTYKSTSLQANEPNTRNTQNTYTHIISGLNILGKYFRQSRWLSKPTRQMTYTCKHIILRLYHLEQTCDKATWHSKAN